MVVAKTLGFITAALRAMLKETCSKKKADQASGDGGGKKRKIASLEIGEIQEVLKDAMPKAMSSLASEASSSSERPKT
eukprot:9973267-Karenia_brevis.AAC.1